MPATISRGRGRRTISEINMVPFIDVMLVLLIIFMVTAPLITPSVVDLPSVGRAAKQPDQVVQIVIGKDEALDQKTPDKTTRLGLRDIAAAVKKIQAGAANPAVVAYNRFACDIDRVAIKLETFIEEFSNILQRNLGAHSASGH